MDLLSSAFSALMKDKHEAGFLVENAKELVVN